MRNSWTKKKRRINKGQTWQHFFTCQFSCKFQNRYVVKENEGLFFQGASKKVNQLFDLPL